VHQAVVKNPANFSIRVREIGEISKEISKIADFQPAILFLGNLAYFSRLRRAFVL